MMKLLYMMLGISSVLGVENQEIPFKDWDADKDGKIERSEFIVEFGEQYTRDIDFTNDRGLDDEDFFNYTYQSLDEDGDGLVNDEEWGYGYDYFYKGYLTFEDLRHYDYDRDSHLSYDEYYDALYDTEFYPSWDTDKDHYVSQYELADELFNSYDIDDSGTLSPGEFRNFDVFYQDV